MQFPFYPKKKNNDNNNNNDNKMTELLLHINNYSITGAITAYQM